jgi:plasmid maintenance system antidote protein VapI
LKDIVFTDLTHTAIEREKQACHGKRTERRPHLKGERAITADTALRLGRYFKMSAQFWLNLRSYYELLLVGERLGRRLEREGKERVTA